MPIKAILFDLDGTLIDFIGFKREACRNAAKAMIEAGLRMGEKECYEGLFQAYLDIGIESEGVFQKFIKWKNGKPDDRILAAALNAYLKTKYASMKPLPGVVETLKELKGRSLKLAIVTDAPRLKAWQRLNIIGLDDMFDVVVTPADAHAVKPSPLPFEKALKELDVKPNEVLMVGDNPKRDIEGAKKVGIKTVFAKYCCNYESEGVEADFEIGKFSELLKIVGHDNG